MYKKSIIDGHILDTYDQFLLPGLVTIAEVHGVSESYPESLFGQELFRPVRQEED